MPDQRTESEVAKYIEGFPSVAELQIQLAANKKERQQLNQMLKIAEQREKDGGPKREAESGTPDGISIA